MTLQEDCLHPLWVSDGRLTAMCAKCQAERLITEDEYQNILRGQMQYDLEQILRWRPWL